MDVKGKLTALGCGFIIIVFALVIWHFTGLYREGKVIAEKKLNDYLEENK